MNCDNSSVFSSPSLSKTHILLVGAGGIGCELLKLLVISGYKNISVVDYSNIEDINVTFTAYAMACNNVGDDPNEAWNIMKALCNID